MALLRALSDADRAIGELAGLGRTVPNPQLLIRPFIRREAVLSSRIEGTQTGIAGLYEYEAKQLSLPLPGPGSNKAEQDAQEVLNYVNALEYGLERLNTLPISLRLIREMHALLLKGVRGERAYPGEFRTSQNWIGGATLNSAVFVPPPPEDMNEALHNLENYMHKPHDYPPLVRLAIIHQQFETIHPFVDGNGRTGRLLISLLLVHWNLLPLPLLYLSAFFERQRRTYYNLLRGVSEDGEWREWILFFLDGVADQARDAVVRANRLQDLRDSYRLRLAQTGTSAKVLLLSDSLFQSPLITVSMAETILGVTHRSAQQNVDRLVETGILTPLRRTARGKLYLAGEIMSIVEQDI
jgi:Fic family protein